MNNCWIPYCTNPAVWRMRAERFNDEHPTPYTFHCCEQHAPFGLRDRIGTPLRDEPREPTSTQTEEG